MRSKQSCFLKILAPYLHKRFLLVGLLSLLQCACLGGTIAQQVARSIALQIADNATTNVIDKNALAEKIAAENRPLKDTPPDRYRSVLFNSKFLEIQPQVEALPNKPDDEETPITMIQSTQLVEVEVWNLLIGDEKRAILERERLKGSQIIPAKEDWPAWQVAVGVVSGADNKTPMYILIPPEFGKMRSGALAMVELNLSNESRADIVNIARYALN